MDDILAKKNRHLFLEEKDNVGNSFIANVNTIVDDLDNINTVANVLGKIAIVADNINNINGIFAFNCVATITLTQDKANGTTLTLPNAMKYRVGTNMLMVSWNGTVCYIGEQYNEIGNFGEWSTAISINVPLKAGDKIQFRIVALTDATTFIGQMDNIIGNTSVIATGSTENRALADRFADIINVKDFGAKGDGVTNDTNAFNSLETLYTGWFINLVGGKYLVDSIPNKNIYYNGYFIVAGNEEKVLNCSVYIEEGTVTGSGWDKPNSIIAGTKPVGFNRDKHNGIYSFGVGSFENIDSTKRSSDVIAIGPGVMSEGHPANFNIGIGAFALHNVDGEYSTSGDRNVAVGSLSLMGLTQGRANVALGRDAGQCISTGCYNVCLGYAAMSGLANMMLSGKIEPLYELTGDGNIGIGQGSGMHLGGASNSNIVIGRNSLRNKKFAESNTIVGTNACHDSGHLESINLKTVIEQEIQGTYSQSGFTLTIVAIGHSAVENRLVRIGFTSGAIKDDFVSTDIIWLKVSRVVNSSTFEIQSPTSLTASGSCVVYAFETDVDSESTVQESVVVGYNANYFNEKLTDSVSIGAFAARDCTDVGFSVIEGALACIHSGDVSFSVVSGYNSCGDSPGEITNSVSIGFQASKHKALEDSIVIGAGAAGGSNDRNILYSVIIGRAAASSLQESDNDVDSCTVIGRYAGCDVKELNKSVFVGMSAGNVSDGQLYECTAIGTVAMNSDSVTSIVRSTAIGCSAQVSGSNQVQLGSTTETTYAYGSVQDRSDARDKTDVRDTELGLDFLLALRPVDFKWDYRDDYIETVEHEVETVNDEGKTVVKIETEVVRHEKDGSRKRNRYHHGLIAQEVKAVLDEKGIDFGGYQDHKINGGKDVLTLGYEEFIAPMIKAIQELNTQLQISNTKIEALMQRISALENNQ